MHKFGTITVLAIFIYASSIFAQRKPHGKLRLLVNHRKINTLIADDYSINNHPVSTLSDAAKHWAAKIPILQACLLPGLSLFADGRPTVCGNHCIFLLAKLLPTKELHKVSADLNLLLELYA